MKIALLCAALVAAPFVSAVMPSGTDGTCATRGCCGCCETGTCQCVGECTCACCTGECCPACCQK